MNYDSDGVLIFDGLITVEDLLGPIPGQRPALAAERLPHHPPGTAWMPLTPRAWRLVADPDAPGSGADPAIVAAARERDRRRRTR